MIFPLIPYRNKRGKFPSGHKSRSPPGQKNATVSGLEDLILSYLFWPCSTSGHEPAIHSASVFARILRRRSCPPEKTPIFPLRLHSFFSSSPHPPPKKKNGLTLAHPLSLLPLSPPTSVPVYFPSCFPSSLQPSVPPSLLPSDFSSTWHNTKPIFVNTPILGWRNSRSD